MAVAPGRLKDVREDEAEGQIKATYEDIKATLRIPFVSLVFRLLANYPDALQLLWRQLKPNTQTVYFESQADEMRRLAVEVVAAGKASAGENEEQARVLKALQYALPKLLLSVTVMRSAVKGQYPRLEELPLEEKRQIDRGVPEGMPSIVQVDLDSLDEASRASLERLRVNLGARTVPLSVGALAAWPSYLSQIGSRLEELLKSNDAIKAALDLQRSALEAGLVMPFRVEANPHALRRVGLSEDDIDSIQDILQNAYVLLPKLLLVNSFLTVGAVGSDQASVSAYPIAGK